MRIGIDFDNTIAGYDDLFAALADEQGLPVPDIGPPSKRAVRDALRARGEDGEITWQRLQASAYGERMHEAELIAGVAGFLARSREQDVPLYIVSHKTRYAAYDDSRTDLRAAALSWMTEQGFFDPDRHGFDPEQVFFEDTRDAKIDRIRDLGFSHFIDDLEEVFLETSFPANVEAILYAPDGPDRAGGEIGESAIKVFPDWDAITEHLLGNSH